MKCKQCGAEVAEGAAFCQACGAALTAPAANSPAPPKATLTAGSTAAAIADSDDVEDTLWEGRFSKLAMVGEWLIAGLLTIAVFIAGVAFGFSGQAWFYASLAVGAVWVALLLRLVYRQLSIRYVMTNQRLVHERGLLWRQIDRIEAIDIDDVTFAQGPVERMLGIGTIKIASSDRTTPEFNLVGIEDVRGVANLIDEVRRKERRKRAVHIESV
jgi:membrane protein YdbS with pleckstrin-like domain